MSSSIYNAGFTDRSGAQPVNNSPFSLKNKSKSQARNSSATQNNKPKTTKAATKKPTETKLKIKKKAIKNLAANLAIATKKQSEHAVVRKSLDPKTTLFNTNESNNG